MESQQQVEGLEPERGAQQLVVAGAGAAAVGAQQALFAAGAPDASWKTGMFSNEWKCSQAIPWGSVIQCLSLRA
jgi:hypothetical protein